MLGHPSESCILYLVSKVQFHKHPCHSYCQTPVLSLGLGVDFTFTWDNNNNNNDKNPQLNLFTGTVLGDKEQGVRDKEGIRPKWSLTLKTMSCLTKIQTFFRNQSFKDIFITILCRYCEKQEGISIDSYLIMYLTILEP